VAEQVVLDALLWHLRLLPVAEVALEAT